MLEHGRAWVDPTTVYGDNMRRGWNSRLCEISPSDSDSRWISFCRGRLIGGDSCSFFFSFKFV